MKVAETVVRKFMQILSSNMCNQENIVLYTWETHYKCMCTIF
jgi:hypothetical protein